MAQNMENEVLIHACCGVCSGYSIELLKAKGYTPVVYFCNPNIDTREEFEKRLAAQRTVCIYHWVELIEERYDHGIFSDAVRGLENEPERGKRCEECIKLRLTLAAKKTQELGLNKFTTSLVISPHKDFKKISSIGTETADSSNVEYLPIDFKKQDGFLKTNRLAKQLGIYRQNYCGCEFAKKHLSATEGK